MLLVGFKGLELDEKNPIVEDIRRRHLGGVILFDYDVANKQPVRNIQSKEQVKRLTASLQELASTPLLIGIDQEGGCVNRLKEKFGFPPTVSAHYLGERDDLAETRKYADSTAGTLAELGINLNFAPCIDLNRYPENPVIGKVERSFSAEPEVVIRHARQWIHSHHEQRVVCTLKHFPGHGSSRQDTHSGFTDVTDFWSENELTPYAEIIDSGFDDVIMTAHIFNRRIDPDFPATLSNKIVTGILREHLHYDGVVISDDMQMGAISSQYGFEFAMQKAIEAGVDMLTFGNNLGYQADVMLQAMETMKKLVVDGTIKPQRIDQSYQRICRLKARFNRV